MIRILHDQIYGQIKKHASQMQWEHSASFKNNINNALAWEGTKWEKEKRKTWKREDQNPKGRRKKVKDTKGNRRKRKTEERKRGRGTTEARKWYVKGF